MGMTEPYRVIHNELAFGSTFYFILEPLNSLDDIPNLITTLTHWCKENGEIKSFNIIPRSNGCIVTVYDLNLALGFKLRWM